MTTNRVMYALLVLLVGVLVGIGVLFVQSNNIDSRTSDQAILVHQLQAAEAQRECQAKLDKAAFATILDLLADNFVTPPAPNPDRLKAVAGMRATANAFRATTVPHCTGSTR